MDKSRFRNYGLWVSVASLILLIFQNSGLGVDVDKYNEIVNAILTVLVALGIVSNPKEGKWFLDESKDEKDE